LRTCCFGGATIAAPPVSRRLNWESHDGLFD
jgi:hypothetical protein